MKFKKFNNKDSFINAPIGDYSKYAGEGNPQSMFKHEINGSHNWSKRRHGDEEIGWEGVRDEIFVKIENGKITISDGNGTLIVEYVNSDVVKSEMKYLYFKIGTIPFETNSTLYITENP